MVRRSLLAAVIIVEVLVILLTPYILGRRQPDFSGVPQVLIDNQENQTFITVHSAFGDYFYTRILLRLSGVDNPGYRGMIDENATYGIQMRVATNVSQHFRLQLNVEVGTGHLYEYNATARLKPLPGEMRLLLQEETSPQQEEKSLPHRIVVSKRRVP